MCAHGAFRGQCRYACHERLLVFFFFNQVRDPMGPRWPHPCRLPGQDTRQGIVGLVRGANEGLVTFDGYAIQRDVYNVLVKRSVKAPTFLC